MHTVILFRIFLEQFERNELRFVVRFAYQCDFVVLKRAWLGWRGAEEEPEVEGGGGGGGGW
jgi:hypothetical protein